MKSCVIIPTLNEENNVLKLYNKILKTKTNLDILFIDDNSSDNTRLVIQKLSKKNKKVKFIFRDNKKGIGSAHKDAIKYAYKKKYNLIITMDADGTHDPKYFKQMIKKAYTNDYVITSRFKKKDLIKDWPLERKIITYLRHFLVKSFLGLSHDASGAYRCFFTKKIPLNLFFKSKNNDYAFFWEVTYLIKLQGFTIYEVPARLVYRKLGKSKMKFKHIIYSLFYLIKILIERKILKN